MSTHPMLTSLGVSALILAVELIAKHCKKLKYIKQIYLVTNGRGRMDADENDIKGIAAKVKEEDIELTVL